ncbi:nucleoside diphosphate-linked moiety X motif 8 [Betta splendens]|uniref:Nucleoside diphosphate-linked moiety X motif 8 n=1 Tax=Betta splendens TaxID=158456 RepID=A0A6P7PA78_BETSP|nr:nucleoside diphosphate-linked moiety X motif 8 [Betta splendens]
MFRSLQTLMRTCSQRFLLLLEEPYLSASTENAGAVRQTLRCVNGSRYTEIPGKSRSNAELSSSTETVSFSRQPSVFCLDCNNHRRKAGSAYSSVLARTSHLQPLRRPWGLCQALLSSTSKTVCRFSQNHLYHTQHPVRPLSLSSHTTGILNEVSYSLQAPQQRTNHRAAAYVGDAWRNCLSRENENRCRQTLAPNLKLYEVKNVGKGSSRNQGKNQGKLASILVSLCSVGSEPVFLFTLRSSMLRGRHKGDVSFAGGKSDPSDSDVVATALREAKEELGVTVAADSVWGVLKPLTDVSGMMIAPVLAHLGPLEEITLKPNPGEVDEIFTMSLSHLCNPQNRGYTHFRTGNKYAYTLPVFCNGKHRVWGLTAVALDQTLKLILPS